jgi:NAD(P)H-hydrate epimerase
MRTLTREQVRDVDRRAIEELGIAGVVLMENAGRQAADVAERMLRDARGRRAIILAASGNNGGDGFVIARHLLVRGLEPRVLLAADPARLTGDALANFRLLAPLGIPVTVLSGDAAAMAATVVQAAEEAELIVDALLGTGLAGEVRDPLRSIIEAIHRCHAGGVAVLAVDIPSGLDADTGRPLGAAVKADVTVTFVAAKKGFAAKESRAYTGKVIVADIGVPGE